MRHVLAFALFVLCSSCNLNQEVIADLRSDEPNRIIKACAKLEDADDAEFVPILLEQPCDPRVTHLLKYKGMSVYQQKMAALKRISGIAPPHKLTYRVDSSIVDFYRKWAIDAGHIK